MARSSPIHILLRRSPMLLITCSVFLRRLYQLRLELGKLRLAQVPKQAGTGKHHMSKHYCFFLKRATK